MEQTLQQKLEQLEDFIDARLPMLEYCRKYEKLIKFDPVERTEEWASASRTGVPRPPYSRNMASHGNHRH